MFQSSFFDQWSKTLQTFLGNSEKSFDLIFFFLLPLKILSFISYILQTSDAARIHICRLNSDCFRSLSLYRLFFIFTHLSLIQKHKWLKIPHNMTHLVQILCLSHPAGIQDFKLWAEADEWNRISPWTYPCGWIRWWNSTRGNPYRQIHSTHLWQETQAFPGHGRISYHIHLQNCRDTCSQGKSFSTLAVKE